MDYIWLEIWSSSCCRLTIVKTVIIINVRIGTIMIIIVLSFGVDNGNLALSDEVFVGVG